MIRIESRANSIIKNVASLKDGASRKEQGCFFFEGAHLLEEFIRSGGKARAVFAAGDNSENTNKRLRDKCATYAVPLYPLPANGEDLARALGKSAKTAAVAVTDEHLCRLVLSRLQG